MEVMKNIDPSAAVCAGSTAPRARRPLEGLVWEADQHSTPREGAAGIRDWIEVVKIKHRRVLDSSVKYDIEITFNINSEIHQLNFLYTISFLRS